MGLCVQEMGYTWFTALTECRIPGKEGEGMVLEAMRKAFGTSGDNWACSLLLHVVRMKHRCPVLCQ